MENNGFLLLFDVKSRNFQLNTIELARLLEEKICAGSRAALSQLDRVFSSPRWVLSSILCSLARLHWDEWWAPENNRKLKFCFAAEHKNTSTSQPIPIIQVDWVRELDRWNIKKNLISTSATFRVWQRGLICEFNKFSRWEMGAAAHSKFSFVDECRICKKKKINRRNIRKFPTCWSPLSVWCCCVYFWSRRKLMDDWLTSRRYRLSSVSFPLWVGLKSWKTSFHCCHI